MIPPGLLGVDPEPDDQPEERPRSSHLSLKDMRVLAAAVVVFVLIMIPIYRQMERTAERHRCNGNIKAIGQAIQLYTSDHEGLPPTHDVFVAETGAPRMEESAAVTWVTKTVDYMSARSSFLCPSAKPAEIVRNLGPGEGVPSAYGMYQPFGGLARTVIERPDQVALVVETSNRGAEGTFDPVPFRDAEGNPAPYDGFVVGWNNGNVWPDATTFAVTRLAYYRTADGKFGEAAVPRHDRGIHFLFADGHFERLGPAAARVRMVSGEAKGMWATPPLSLLRR